MKNEIKTISKFKLITLEKDIKKIIPTKTIGGARGTLDMGSLSCAGAPGDCDKPWRV